jgi:tRNA(Ile)-lysidine synthase
MPSSTRSADTRSETGSDLDEIDAAARALIGDAIDLGDSLVLSVSGGCDSMVLLHAVAHAWRASSCRPSHAAPSVVTFDHGTGPQATVAADLVAREARRLGLPVRVGRASPMKATEAEWRSARWRFVRRDAPLRARFVTAHTRDDHLETVVIRAMRDAGARGLAGLAAPSRDVARPFLAITRRALREYAGRRAVPYVDDPSNASRAHLRNRIRLDLLPALLRVRPRLGDELLAVAERAALLRNEIDDIARRFVIAESANASIRVARAELATYDSEALCVLWPAIAARALVTLDRRGTLRLAQFTSSGAPGARIQLSGGIEVYRHRDAFVVRRTAPIRPNDEELPLVGVVQLGGWRFRPHASPDVRASRSSAVTRDAGRSVRPDDAWSADLPADRRLTVRAWRAADRMRAHEQRAARRVKRFFGDARIPGPVRNGWPVVLADDEIVWIPGVRRTAAASDRSGRPVVRYTCERFDGAPPGG